jgi:hypothetical protein
LPNIILSINFAVDEEPNLCRLRLQTLAPSASPQSEGSRPRTTSSELVNPIPQMKVDLTGSLVH